MTLGRRRERAGLFTRVGIGLYRGTRLLIGAALSSGESGHLRDLSFVPCLSIRLKIGSNHPAWSSGTLGKGSRCCVGRLSFYPVPNIDMGYLSPEALRPTQGLVQWLRQGRLFSNGSCTCECRDGLVCKAHLVDWGVPGSSHPQTRLNTRVQSAVLLISSAKKGAMWAQSRAYVLSHRPQPCSARVWCVCSEFSSNQIRSRGPIPMFLRSPHQTSPQPASTLASTARFHSRNVPRGRNSKHRPGI